MVIVACAAIACGAAAVGSAQETLVYSFEPDLEGFAANGGGLTITHETSGLGATHGANSMKLAFTELSSFAGALTSNVHSAFLDPLGVDFLRFDLTNTNRFVPPNPVAGQDPTFANTSVTFFGEFSGAPGEEAQIQFFFSEEPIGNLEAGTHEVEIDLTAGGLWVQGGEIKSYDEYIADGFMPLGMQIYVNKSVKFMDPDFAWTIYFDNIRVGRTPLGVLGDFNEDGRVDAADYAKWRQSEGDTDPLPNDNGIGTPIDSRHYDLWRANFGEPIPGGGALGAVPEPASASLLLAASACWYLLAGRFPQRSKRGCLLYRRG
jgi:hypothetical protein